MAPILTALLLAGCQSPSPDVAGSAAKATGMADAIVFQKPGKTSTSLPADKPGKSLTPDEALRLALRHDPRIGQALARVRIAQAEADQARLLPNPVLNVDVRFAEGGGQNIFETTLTGDLIAVLEKPGRIRAADQRLRGAAAEAVTIVLDVISEVRQAYASVQAMDAEMVLIQERMKILQRLRDLADARYRTGEGLRLDVLTLDAQRAQLGVELSQKQLEQTRDRLLLARLIGDPSGSADWSLPPWQAPPPLRGSERAWVETALANRPEIQSQTWELAALGEEVKLAALTPLEGGEVGAHGERDASWMVGPTVTTPLPVFDMGQASRAKARAQRLEARHKLWALEMQVIEEVRRAHAGYASARAVLESAQNELLPLQEQQHQQAELAYRSGEADVTTLLAAESALLEARSQILDLQQKVTVAGVQLERAVGGAGIAAMIPSTQPAISPATTQPDDNNTGSR